MASKEAVVFVLDANVSMNASYPKNNAESTTRLDCAKQTVQEMISDLLIRSKTNEACVIVLKTLATEHHFYSQKDDEENDDDSSSIPFPNITELSGDGRDTRSAGSGVSRPSAELVRRVASVRSVSKEQAKFLRGDFCDGIIVAADALHRRTFRKQYQRRIILITDAEHEVMVDQNQILVVLDSLREMKCRLEVIGLDFAQSAEFTTAAAPPTANPVKPEQSIADNNDSVTGAFSVDQKDRLEGGDDGSSTEVSAYEQQYEDESSTDSDVEDKQEHTNEVKQQNERLLIGLTEKTGGFVIAAHAVQQILDSTLGRRIPKSTRRKFVFHIAPGLVLETARFSLLLSKTSAPSLKKEVVMVADNIDDGPLMNILGQEMTSNIQTIVSHWDPDREDREITDDVADAYRYGCDLVPIGDYDLKGFKEASPVCIKILGYMDVSKVPRYLLIGPPYAISGGESRRACVAISGLARALHRLHQVGIATMVKTKDADPILVGIFPLKQEKDLHGHDPTHLTCMQLPFRGDVTKMSLPSFKQEIANSIATPRTKSQACDQMIESLMLPANSLKYSHIPNPYIRAFRKTIVNRVVDPNCPVVAVRPKNGDPMVTPRTVLEQSRPHIQSFRRDFPLTKVTNSVSKDGAKRKSRPVSYLDFADNC